MVFAIIIPIALYNAIKFGSSFLSNTDITRIGYIGIGTNIKIFVIKLTSSIPKYASWLSSNSNGAMASSILNANDNYDCRDS